MTDKTGCDAAEFRTITEGGRTFREPVLTGAHRQEMLRDLGGAVEDPQEVIIRLYRAGWSYRLIAQFCGMSNEEALTVIVEPVRPEGMYTP
jgi:DNA-directed RNA polymerase specialized sigma24 family protein